MQAILIVCKKVTMRFFMAVLSLLFFPITAMANDSVNGPIGSVCSVIACDGHSLLVQSLVTLALTIISVIYLWLRKQWVLFVGIALIIGGLVAYHYFGRAAARPTMTSVLVHKSVVKEEK